MTDTSLCDLVVGVTIYRPNIVDLESLIVNLKAFAHHPVLVIDGPTGQAIEADDLARLKAMTAVDIVQFADNRGVGAGLNAIVERAKARGARFVHLFDQDSAPCATLAVRLREDCRALQAAGERVAAIGPRPIPRRGSGTKAPTYRRRPLPLPRARLHAVDFLITSGTLIRLDAIDDIGGFTEPYRMDAIDLEWCFRAWARGWSIWFAEDIEMEHSVGSAQVTFGPLSFPLQTESRMRSYVRAQAHLLTRRYVPLRWKARSAIYVPAQAIIVSTQSAHPAKTFLGLVKAAIAGLKSRFDQS